MSVKILSVTLLLLCACLCLQSSAGNRLHPTKVYPCCAGVSSDDISAQITGEHGIQKARGPCVDAIIFPTKEGKVCVDPRAEWYSIKPPMRIIHANLT
uniref:Chemokine interleukin-8-like domain-containing protein n=1 Tax=Anabas testudineus TaxID=64144 RepID=A0A3Q1JA93_ANATE